MDTSKHFQTNTIIAMNLQKCRNKFCKIQTEAFNKPLLNLSAESTKLYLKLEAKQITEKTYSKEMKKIQNQLKNTLEYIESLKCDLKRCEQETRKFLQTVMRDANAKETLSKLTLPKYKKITKKYL